MENNLFAQIENQETKNHPAKEKKFYDKMVKKRSDDQANLKDKMPEEE